MTIKAPGFKAVVDDLIKRIGAARILLNKKVTKVDYSADTGTPITCRMK